MSTITADKLLGIHDWRDQYEQEQYEELRDAMTYTQAEYDEAEESALWYDEYLEARDYDYVLE
jgi:hypothetical protein